jgi:hypothetical protein
MRYDGETLINHAMTANMAKLAGASWYQACEDCTFPSGVETSPQKAPWYDSKFIEESLGFFGLVATSISPYLSSSAIRNVYPLAKGGAALGPRYEQHREIVVAATLMARDRQAAVYGMRWLNNLLSFGSSCDESKRDASGYTVEGWLWCPPKPWGEHVRLLYDVHVTQGPTVLRERNLQGGCGGHIIDVEFTLTAQNPAIYGITNTFGALDITQQKDKYSDLLTTALPHGAVSGAAGKRTYDDVRSMVEPAPDTSYDEVLAALIFYSSGKTVDNIPGPVF